MIAICKISFIGHLPALTIRGEEEALIRRGKSANRVDALLQFEPRLRGYTPR